MAIKLQDRLHRFIIERSNVRGKLIHLDATWQALLERNNYPAPVREVLGQALAATALLASTIKFDGSLILQTNSDGPLRMLVVQASSRRTLRGLAHWSGAVDGLSFEQLVGDGRLAITIDPGKGDRYQGIVALKGGSFAAVLQQYFLQSEQLPTRLWLAADASRAAGLLLQNLPGEERDADAWERCAMLADTLSEQELLDLPAETLLRRLYHEEQVRLFRPEGVRFECGCSRERVGAVLISMGREELGLTLAEQDVVTVDCEFCAAAYTFDAVDIEQLIIAGEETPLSQTRH